MLYQFYKNEEIVGTKAQPNWINLQKNGYYGLCDFNKCEGVAIDGNPYHLEGREGLSNLETVNYVCISEDEYKQQILGTTNDDIQNAIKEGVNSI